MTRGAEGRVVQGQGLVGFGAMDVTTCLTDALALVAHRTHSQNHTLTRGASWFRGALKKRHAELWDEVQLSDFLA